jgi:CheY-like chemotaxis protein/glycine cleavage system H lipoate-binding protein
MVVVLVLLTVLVFIAVDVGSRLVFRRIDAARLRKERLEALDRGLRLEFETEAKSLKRVTVKEPRARILAVDDEPVVLDSFRKILVVAGYSVDTVEDGREALCLIQAHDYDFVFTDLKMPEYDGLEVTKAVKHLRPDIDVMMITGYATIESAVDAMKYGAMDYVQKPFTEDELVEFVNRALIRRQATIEQQTPPKLHLVTNESPLMEPGRVFNIPAGVFVSPDHVWVRLEMDGEVRTGVDDFARKTIGAIDDVIPPKIGREVQAGDPLFAVRQQSRTMTFPSPVTGRVTRINPELEGDVVSLMANPYKTGWICGVEATNLPSDLDRLKIGAGAVSWYEEEIERLLRMLADDTEGEPVEARTNGDGTKLSDESWKEFSTEFVHT